MQKVFKSIVAALVAGSALITTMPAQARGDHHRDYRDYRGGYERHYDRRGYRDHDRRWRHGYRDHRRYNYYPRSYYGYRGHPRVYYRDYYRDDDGAVIAAGLIGLAIGAAIASDRDRGYRYRDRDYDYYRD